MCVHAYMYKIMYGHGIMEKCPDCIRLSLSVRYPDFSRQAWAVIWMSFINDLATHII